MAPSGSAPPSSEPPPGSSPGAVEVFDVAIVGAGPVGLFAAYYDGFRGLSTVVIVSLPLGGEQIATFYADSVIYHVPAFPEIVGSELVRRLEQQASRFPIAYRLAQEVVAMREEDGRLALDARDRLDGARDL